MKGFCITSMDESKYKTATKVAIALFEGWEKFGCDPNYYKKMVTTLSDVIYQCPKIHSGYVSEEANTLSVKEVCKEHFYSRTQSAKKMVELMEKGLLNAERLDRFEAFMKSRARVHYVTSKENTYLIKFQSNPELNHWKKQYEAAGISLKKWERTQQKFVYDIEGKTFKSAPEAAAAMNCHESTVVKRCGNEKWPNWSRTELYK